MMMRHGTFRYAPDAGAGGAGSATDGGTQSTPAGGGADSGASLRDIMGGTEPDAEPSTQTDDKGSGGKGAAGGEGAETPAWMQQLTEDMRSDGELSRFQSLKELASAYKELAKDAGGKLKPPAPDAKPEEVQAFFEALGKPKTADKYTLTAPDGSDAKEFKELAFAANLTDAQAKTVYEALGKVAASTVEARRAQLERQFSETDEALHKEYGAKYGEKMELLKRGMQTFAGQNVAAKLRAAGLSFDADIVRMFVRLGEMNAEAGTVTQGAAGSSYRPTSEGGSFEFKGL